MRPIELLQHFIAIIPEFRAQWDSERNYNRCANGNFTLHGVCCEFSDFYREHYASLNDEVYKQLFEFIELHLVEPNSPDTTLDNALCTCFLENISSEPCGQAAVHWLGVKSRKYFDKWHAGPPH